MRLLWLLAFLAAPAVAQEQEIHRALIQRDQQTAEFAARVRSGIADTRLEQLHARQLSEALVPLSSDPSLARLLLPYQRERMAEERVLVLPPPVVRVPPPASPLPLPGSARAGIDLVAPEGIAR